MSPPLPKETNPEMCQEHTYTNGAPPTFCECLLDKYLYHPIVNLLPKSLAPNLITTSGLTVILSLLFIVIYHDRELKAELPSWVYLYGAFAMFFYISCDYTDGKQARKNGTGSSLGAFFDQASDGFGHAVAYIIVLLQLVKLGEHPYVALIFSLSTYWCCFLSYYEHRQTGTLRWAEGQMGDLEGYLLLVLGSLFSGIFGTSFLNSNILIWIVPDHSGIYLSFGFFYLLIGFKTYITMGYLSLKSVFTHPKVDKKSALCELLPISIITLFGLLWGFTNQFSGNVGLSLVALGWCCCHILLKISITICWQNIPFKSIQCSCFYLLLPLSIVLLSTYPSLCPSLAEVMSYMNRPENINIFLFLFGVVILLLNLLEWYLVTKRACKTLGIKCYTVKPFINS